MKRKLMFGEKLRVFAHWMRQHKTYGLQTCCSLCDSTLIKRIDSQTNQDGSDVYYSARYKCMSCGANALGNEMWSPEVTQPDAE